MAEKKKAIDGNGLLFIWKEILGAFVQKDGNKVLSTNDYTTADKNKLAGIAEGANNTTVRNTLESDSETDALSAKQGKVLDEKIANLKTGLEGAGTGDMSTTKYDSNNDGTVDKADKADDADKLGGELPSAYVKQTEIKTVAKTGSYKDLTDKPENFAPATHNHQMSEVSGLVDALAGKSANGHKHTTSEITDFSTEMAKKADKQHTHEQSEINGLSKTIEDVTAIANGKCHAEVFDTVSDMETWLSNSDNTEGLKVGDVFLIRATDVPDYWWDGTYAQVLETTKVEIEFLTNEEILEILANA